MTGALINNGFSIGTGINDFGDISGLRHACQRKLPCLPDQQRNITDLGTLPGGSNSNAYAVNNQGQVVGYSSRKRTPARRHFSLRTAR